MGTIKDRNGMDLIEVDNIKKRWQEYTEFYQKNLHDPDNHDGVITHLEPDILEWKVKWTLGSITTNKASGGDRIPVELFQILKDDAVLSAALNMSANLENPAVATGLEKVIPIPKKGNAKECSNYCTTALISHASISHASKVTLKILQAKLQQYVNFQMFKLDLQKAEEPEIKLPASVGS